MISRRLFSVIVKDTRAARRLRSTVDTKDVEFHTTLLKDWWNPNGIIQPLHSLNILRVPHVRDGLVKRTPSIKYSECLKDFKILDVGCGGGIFSENLAYFGAKVTGIDAGKDLINLAIQHSQNNKRLDNNRPQYICTSIEDHVKEFPEQYDAVAVSEVLEHVLNKDIFLEACVRAVKPGGKLFFTTPTRSRTTQVLGIFLAEYIVKVIPKGTHQYEKFMTPNELKYFLEINDCDVQSIRGMAYHFWSNKWEWIESKKLHFAIEAVKLK
ncbi:ubiquinone biosynthesis O-methyltransferase, mitochondrial-like [Aricia agestis]|uniref:ubiquinone biosynthesis O-methyltransferase, mitochondrial-like n=1 Tax=Aricia agestis TaxID=91739 RepID=UPI001C206633|nr:ubiquinone biosynthesis O-methyltransferase, mitochondrial-like [Aricia agestis]